LTQTGSCGANDTCDQGAYSKTYCSSGECVSETGTCGLRCEGSSSASYSCNAGQCVLGSSSNCAFGCNIAICSGCCAPQ
jgi:hypothetical protein